MKNNLPDGFEQIELFDDQVKKPKRKRKKQQSNFDLSRDEMKFILSLGTTLIWISSRLENHELSNLIGLKSRKLSDEMDIPEEWLREQIMNAYKYFNEHEGRMEYLIGLINPVLREWYITRGR